MQRTRLFRSVTSTLRRRIHSEKPKGNGSIVDADASISLNQHNHNISLLLAGLAPVALLLSPSILNVPLDYAFAIAIPFHAHVSLNHVITDYIPKQMRSMIRAGLLGATLITVLGILKLNWEGPGLTQTIKGLWQPKKNESNTSTSSHGGHH